MSGIEIGSFRKFVRTLEGPLLHTLKRGRPFLVEVAIHDVPYSELSLWQI